ncbi:MAG: transcriptional regulator [Alteromonadaceae bacterium]|nr:transcriptional regulator [Alteromonadaceae bacterium]MBB17888.1 transcriptional regulator [Rickettsiales bacterium]
MKESELLIEFGKKVQEIRKSRSLSQENLAHLADIDRTYISSLERGKRNVSLLNIIKVANALCVSPETFLRGLGDYHE